MKASCALWGLALAVPLPAMAQWAPDRPTAFTPTDETTDAGTGPVILSDERIVFGNGERLDLELVPEAASEGYPEVYRLIGEVGPLVNSYQLCGGERPAHVGVGLALSEGQTFLHLSFFKESEAGPTDIAAICGPFNYVPPQEWVDAVSELRAKPEAPDPAAPADPGRWRISRSTNPVDDSETVILSLTASSGQPS